MSADVKPPEMKSELSLSRCPNPRIIVACGITKQALEWVRRNTFYYRFNFYGGAKKVPFKINLEVNPNFTFDEVFNYMASPDFVGVHDEYGMSGGGGDLVTK